MHLDQTTLGTLRGSTGLWDVNRIDIIGTGMTTSPRNLFTIMQMFVVFSKVSEVQIETVIVLRDRGLRDSIYKSQIPRCLREEPWLVAWGSVSGL
ncbi:uncharacterized protein [Littorina saxatilis]